MCGALPAALPERRTNAAGGRMLRHATGLCRRAYRFARKRLYGHARSEGSPADRAGGRRCWLRVASVTPYWFRIIPYRRISRRRWLPHLCGCILCSRLQRALLQSEVPAFDAEWNWLGLRTLYGLSSVSVKAWKAHACHIPMCCAVAVLCNDDMKETDDVAPEPQ